MNSLHRLRQMASYGTMALVWINLVLLAVRYAFRPEGFDTIGMAIGSVISLGVSVLWFADKTGATIRIVNSMALAAQVAILVYAFAGSPLQIDMHMYFFATLAISAVWVDWRAIIAYAGVVAVHHLLLYFLFPAAVFPGQSDFTRVILHAVILIAQAGVMIYLTNEIARSFGAADKAAKDAIAANGEAANQAEQARRNSSLVEDERACRELEKSRETESMIASVDKLAQGLEALAGGNLSYRIDEALHERIDGLRYSFNQSLEKLEWTLLEVGQAADIVRQDTLKISRSNDDLATRSEQQAVSVEETAASLSEVTTTVRDTSKRAEQVGRLVDQTRTNAQNSAGVVTNAVSAMGKIADSSNQISQIIGVIDEIAFQTNLLALNAGVEAARAGDAGKGFAVVAQEVRELAQRSATAAKEIKALINTSSEQVKQGVQLVGDTGNALNSIASEVNDIATHIDAIVQGAREQTIGLEGINGALNGIDQNTQRNAAMVQASTTAVHSLAKEAETLEKLLAKFSLEEKKAAASDAARRAA